MKALAFSGGKDSMACLHLLRHELDCAIYVDTGFTYPETQQMVAYACTLLPVHRVRSDRQGQQRLNGLPSDVVPVEWTVSGQSITGKKATTIQSSLQCCYENLSKPLLDRAKSLGVTHLVYGQRHEEAYKAPSRHGDMVEGMIRLHPIEDWTTEQVFDYLATKMTVPEHYRLTRSSLDCYDCPAYRRVSQDLHAWTKEKYPQFYAAYQLNCNAVYAAIQEAL
jgi:3'-phosphoadenosine 5'-phosphosulfate sulfotransferase (PAPS reductase)/FAD synthetase